jgi:hypothetical protein
MDPVGDYRTLSRGLWRGERLLSGTSPVPLLSVRTLARDLRPCPSTDCCVSQAKEVKDMSALGRTPVLRPTAAFVKCDDNK